MPDIIWALVISFAINMAMFLVAFRHQTDKLTDISYAITFVVLAAYGLLAQPFNWPRLILFGMVFAWAMRLGVFLLVRIWRTGVDHRFDEMRGDFAAFARFWVGQAVAVWVILLPALLALFQGHLTLGMVSYVGLAIWLAGLVIETIADLQKYRFAQNPANRNAWIQTGIWKYSRHPNYFGEILVWVGIYWFVIPGLSSIDAYIAAIGPLFIITLLMFVSGIPLLEKSADAKWGKNPEYQRYKKYTSLLVLWPRK